MNGLTDALPLASPEGDASSGIIRTSVGTAELLRSARAIPREIWRATFEDEARDARYYEIIEETLPGKYEYRYVVLRNAETGQTAVQPMFVLPQCLTDGLPQRIQQMVGRVQRKFPNFLVMRVLMVGCAVGEGQVGGARAVGGEGVARGAAGGGEARGGVGDRLQGLSEALPGDAGLLCEQRLLPGAEHALLEGGPGLQGL